MKKLLLLFTISIFVVSCNNSTESTPQEVPENDVNSQSVEEIEEVEDLMEIAVQLAQIEKFGVPTIETVNAMKLKADALYDASNWTEAIIAYELYAKNINWLSNLLSQGLQPYYSASYDSKKSVSYSLLKSMIPIEAKSNEYKIERNIAYVKIGICYKNIGDTKNAVAYLYKSLDILSVDEIEYWKIAQNALMEIVGYKKE